MTDPEIEHARLVSGSTAALTAATEGLHDALLDVDRAQEDLAGCIVSDWSGLAAEAYAVRHELLRQQVAQAHVALALSHAATAMAGDAYAVCEDVADVVIAQWRRRPAGMPELVEEIFARLVNGLLLRTGTTYNARLAAAGAVLTGDDEDLAELSDEAREWVENGLARNQDWLDDHGSTLGPRIPSIGAWGDGRGLIPQGLGYDPASGLLLQGYYDKGDGDPSVMALVDEVTGEQVGEVNLGGLVHEPGKEDVDHGTPGHAGGVTVDGDRVHVTDKGKVYTYSLDAMRSAGAGTTVQPEAVSEVPHGGSYSAMHDGLLYLGTFTEEGDGSLHVYRPDGAGGWTEMPEREVATPPRCQGVVVRDGELVFATSLGRDNQSSLVVQGEDGSRESFDFPNMAEGLVEVDGRLVVTYESGATEYDGTGEDRWANRTMTSTPLSALGLGGEVVMGAGGPRTVAAELDVPARVLRRVAQHVGTVTVTGSDLGQVPQAGPFARAVRTAASGLADALRTSGRAVAHAADGLRAAEADAARTDDAVHSGFDRARLD